MNIKFIFASTKNINIMKFTNAFFIYRESGYDASKKFKTSELADKHAKKMGYSNYEIRTVITRK